MLIFHETRNLAPKARQRCFETETNLISAIEKLLARGYATGEFQMDDIAIVAHNIVVNGEMWAVRRWFLKECCTLEEYTEREIDIIFRGIRKGKNLSTAS